MNFEAMNREMIEEGNTCKTQTNMLKRFIAVSPLMIAALVVPESAFAAYCPLLIPIVEVAMVMGIAGYHFLLW